jgi:hypothetical protein
VLEVIQGLQAECDKLSSRILERYINSRQLGQLQKELTRKKADGGLDVNAVDPREVGNWLWCWWLAGAVWEGLLVDEVCKIGVLSRDLHAGGRTFGGDVDALPAWRGIQSVHFREDG